MKVTSIGSVINNIKAIDKSLAYKDFIAFQDEDGAVIHIRISELEKLHKFYISNITKIETVPVDELPSSKLDTFFV